MLYTFIGHSRTLFLLDFGYNRLFRNRLLYASSQKEVDFYFHFTEPQVTRGREKGPTLLWNGNLLRMLTRSSVNRSFDNGRTVCISDPTTLNHAALSCREVLSERLEAQLEPDSSVYNRSYFRRTSLRYQLKQSKNLVKRLDTLKFKGNYTKTLNVMKHSKQKQLLKLGNDSRVCPRNAGTLVSQHK